MNTPSKTPKILEADEAKRLLEHIVIIEGIQTRDKLDVYIQNLPDSKEKEFLQGRVIPYFKVHRPFGLGSGDIDEVLRAIYVRGAA